MQYCRAGTLSWTLLYTKSNKWCCDFIFNFFFHFELNVLNGLLSNQIGQQQSKSTPFQISLHLFRVNSFHNQFKSTLKYKTIKIIEQYE